MCSSKTLPQKGKNLHTQMSKDGRNLLFLHYISIVASVVPTLNKPPRLQRASGKCAQDISRIYLLPPPDRCPLCGVWVHVFTLQVRELRFAEADCVRVMVQPELHRNAFCQSPGPAWNARQDAFQKRGAWLLRTNRSIHSGNLYIERGVYSAWDLYGALTCDSLGPSAS